MGSEARAEPDRILVVKLADLGDLLTATPALRTLRNTFPRAHITALVTPHTAPLLWRNDSVDQIIAFPKALYDDPRSLTSPGVAPGALCLALRLGLQLRSGHFDTVVLLHHMTTRWGRLKYRALLAATGARIRVGLDDAGRSLFTHAALDRGFGERHEVDYWLEVVGLLGRQGLGQGPEDRAPRAGGPAALGQEDRGGQLPAAPPTAGGPAALELHLAEEELAEADARWEKLGLAGRSVVALHPGSGTFSLAKRWAPEGYAAVGEALAREGLHPVVVAGPGEEELAWSVQKAIASQVNPNAQGSGMHPEQTIFSSAALQGPGPSTLLGDVVGPRLLAALLRRCRLFVGNDSGVMHLAAAVGVPVVGVFGLSNHRAWGPYPPGRHRVVRLDLPCSPCFYRGSSLGTPEGCPPRTCLTELTPDLVIAAARELLATSSR